MQSLRIRVPNFFYEYCSRIAKDKGITPEKEIREQISNRVLTRISNTNFIDMLKMRYVNLYIDEVTVVALRKLRLLLNATNSEIVLMLVILHDV